MASLFSKNGASIGNRIGWLVARAVFAAVVTASLVLTYVQASQEIERTRKGFENTGYVLAAGVADAVVKNDRNKAFESLSAVSRIPEILMVAISGTDGKVLANLGQATVLQTDIMNSGSTGIEMLFKGRMPVAIDIVQGGVLAGKLTMIADISSVREVFLLTLLSTLAAALAASCIGMLVSRPLQRRIIEPVAGLTHQIAKIKNSRNYDTSITTDIENDIGEVGVLVESFNTLMGDIRQRDDVLKRLAYFDPMTGLPNRLALLERLAEARHETKGALVVLDLRRFRSLNEAFGQATGDALLRLAAHRFQASLTDGYLARIGGHEFAVHCPDLTDRKDVAGKVQDIRSHFARPLSLGHRGVKVDVDAGILMLGELSAGQPDGDLLLQCAGLALNQARQASLAGSAFFEGEMRDRTRMESELGQELRAAVADGGLEVHYQCVMDLRSGSITGFEALARWCHPSRGYISPVVFIPIAENNGLIADLGRWILNEACRQSAQWYRQTGLRRVISVNVSAAQFLEAGFTEDVEACLQRHGLAPDLLCLELTESVFIGASAAAIRESLHVLAGLGVKLALDDFGTGYSSLGYLARLPFSVIKIDRAFVANAETAPRRKALLKSIIDMSHSVSMEVVAEGAETEAEIILLRELGAEKVQGYAIARPKPAAEAFVAAQAAENAIFAVAVIERVA